MYSSGFKQAKNPRNSSFFINEDNDVDWRLQVTGVSLNRGAQDCEAIRWNSDNKRQMTIRR
jgi:hypothetical protein